MVFKKLLEKLRKNKTDQNIKKDKKTKKQKKENPYPNRFLKFYHLNQKRLSKERRSDYHQKKKEGVCTRCKQKVVEGIVFCEYHQQKQKGYNLKARNKEK